MTAVAQVLVEGLGEGHEENGPVQIWPTPKAKDQIR